MTATSYCRGWEIEYDGEKWIFSDTKKPCWINDRRPCRRCEMPPTKEGSDACLGNLPGVESACCGHGVKEPYIIYKNKR